MQIQASLPVLLTIVFVVLRLCGVIAWPWIWVVSPVWISFVFVAVLVALYLVWAFVMLEGL